MQQRQAVAWALLLSVAVRLLWQRGQEGSLSLRLQLARHRFTRPTAGAAALALGLVLGLGAFIFYNTNVLNDYSTAAERTERRGEYERRYRRYKQVPQPRLADTHLRVELYPQRREAQIQGTYRLVNDGAEPIDSIHLATRADLFFGEASRVEISEVGFDRPARPVLMDEELGHRIYALEEPLRPGQSLQLSFEERFESHGFTNSGIDPSVVANGTYFTSQSWLPTLGYQPVRELTDARARLAQGLTPRPAYPSLADAEARQDRAGAGRMTLEAVVGTGDDQIAVAPGSLRQTWTEGGRRYFRYSTDVPIGQQYAIFSARYSQLEERWNDVAIQIFHHPDHDAGLDSMLRSVKASLEYYSEQLGPYPYRYIRFIEHPGRSLSPHAEATTIDFEEAFALLNPEGIPRGLDLMFWVTAHETAHQWGVRPARVEGALLLSESLATYSAIRVTEETYGVEYLRRFLRLLRDTNPIPHTRAAGPLLQATDSYLGYRKGPFALYALGEYVGKERVNEALRSFRDKYLSGSPPLPTSLDLYRELQAVTPASLRTLLHDLFEANTFWEFETRGATARRINSGAWEVTLELQARKLVVDQVGDETEVPMDDWVEIGVVASLQGSDGSGEQIYLQKERIRSGRQTITVIVPHKPTQAGVDPHHLLIEWEMDDNLVEVKVDR